MEPRNSSLRVRQSYLLSRRDWVYLLSLLVPFVVYDLTLKALLVVSWPEDPGLLGSLDLMRSDLLFSLGYVAFWIGLFAVARSRFSRRAVVFLFHVATIVVALITTCAYQYFEVTGSTLDSDYIILWLSSPHGTEGAIASEVTPGLLVLIASVLVYALLGPPLVTRLVGWWRGWPDVGAQAARISWLRLASVVLAAYALFSLSLLPGAGWIRAGNSFSRDAVVNIVMTAADVAEGEGLPHLAAEPVAQSLPADASL